MYEKSPAEVPAIRAIIPEYPGYGDEASRLQSDRLIRAWIGSCLASLRERLGGSLDPRLAAQLDDAILRCQFPDQRYVAQIGHAHLDAATEAFMVKHDLRLLELAQSACAIDAAALPELLSSVNAAFDQRTPVSA